jgi:short-subunit dehydrogenase
MASFLPGPQAGIYTASKFAVRGLTECLRDNLAPYKIGVSLMTPALVVTNAYESALGRPAKYANTAVSVTREAVEQMKPIFDAGMDPVEVGEKTLRGIKRNDLYIITHPENKDEVRELCEAIRAAKRSKRCAGKPSDARTRKIGIADLLSGDQPKRSRSV